MLIFVLTIKLMYELIAAKLVQVDKGYICVNLGYGRKYYILTVNTVQ